MSRLIAVDNDPLLGRDELGPITAGAHQGCCRKKWQLLGAIGTLLLLAVGALVGVMVARKQQSGTNSTCDGSPCNIKDVNATCTASGASYTCHCSDSYFGPQCTEPGCESNPCQHGGTCVVLPDGHGHICHCAHGWEGPDCEKGTGCVGNRCKSKDLNATCTASGANYTCLCSADSYFGPQCIEPLGCVPNPCQHCGVCMPRPDLPRKFKCYCPSNAGWSGPTCKSNTACDHLDCRHNGTCQVPAHSTGCASSPCENGVCEEQMPDGHICHCNRGWEGANCDRPNATARSPPCVAPPPLQGTCNCPPGWSGPRCETAKACNPNPCEHDGQCVPSSDGRGYQCNCNGTGYTGPHCEFNGCHPDPCKNGGKCHPVPGSDTQYTCDCSHATPAGTWAGQNCEYVACDLICAEKCSADADPKTGKFNCTHDNPLSNHAGHSTRKWPSAHRQPANWDGEHEVLTNVDLGPLGTYDKVLVGDHWTYEDCQKLCTQNYPQCKAWVFRVNETAAPGDSKTCSLKQGVRATTCPHLSCHAPAQTLTEK
eukprot:COSAG01_NODE_6807_length_3488_cov_18.608865_1_plen_539_part_00